MTRVEGGVRKPVRLDELLGPEFSRDALDKLDNESLEARILDLEHTWRRWLAHEHGSRGPQQGAPDKETLERGIPVLRAILAARQSESGAEDNVAQIVAGAVRHARREGADVRSAIRRAPNRAKLATREGVVLRHPPNAKALELARQLVENRYRAMGYLTPVQQYQWSSAAVPLVARHNSQVVATAALITSAAGPLPLEEVFPEEVAALRAQGLRLAELGAFAADADIPRQLATHATMTLAETAYEAICRVKSLDLFMVAVHPHHAGFYQKRYGAKLLVAEPRPHPKVEGSPAVLLGISPRGKSGRAGRDMRYVAKMVAATLDGLAAEPPGEAPVQTANAARE